ncbi:MAG: indole-3-glycerol phosphate synthase TrpC [Chloroflexota bacterium]
MTILDEIFAHKKRQVAAVQAARPLAAVRVEAEATSVPPDFVQALRSAHRPSRSPALIAEVKKASPSRGLLCPDFDPLRLARTYAENGAAAISVLTDEKYFQGHLDYLRQIHTALPHTPLLRKDFVLDAYQVYEARAAGASAVLLIAAYLDAAQMADLHALILALDMAPLVEVHDAGELAAAMQLPGLKLLGVNNRNLHDFSVKLETCLALRPLVPPEICFVAESAIHTRQDVRRLAEAGVDAMLIGEALVVAQDRATKIDELMGET